MLREPPDVPEGVPKAFGEPSSAAVAPWNHRSAPLYQSLTLNPPTRHDAAVADDLSRDLERALDGLWARRVVRALTPRREMPWALRAALCSLLLGGLSVAGALALGEPLSLLGLHAWAVALLFTALVLYDLLARWVVAAFREAVIPALSAASLARARALLDASPALRWQAALSAGVGLVTVALFTAALAMVTGRLAPFAAAQVAVGSALTTNLVYVPGAATVMALLARDTDAVAPVAPQHSPLVRALARAGHWTVMVTAALSTVGVLAPLVLPGLGLLGPVLAALVLCGAVASTGAQFVVQQVVIAAVVNARRDRTLDELQARVAALWPRLAELSPAERDELMQLSSLHDRVAQAPDLFGSLRALLEFARPLVVPLASAVLVNLHRLPASASLDALARALRW